MLRHHRPYVRAHGDTENGASSCSLGEQGEWDAGSLATAFRPCITELARAGPILRSGTPYSKYVVPTKAHSIQYRAANRDSKEGQLNCPIAVKATTLHLLESGVARMGTIGEEYESDVVLGKAVYAWRQG